MCTEGRREQARGATLLETMIVVSIVAIVGSLAVPSMSDLYLDSGRTTAVNGFIHALYLARSEAIKRGSVVSVCKSSDGHSCNRDVTWKQGWIVFANDDRDEPPQIDAGETVLLVNQGWDAGEITSNRTSYSFRAYNQSVVNGTLVFCDRRGSAHARAIIISHTGRARVARRDAGNSALTCGSS